MREQEYEQLKKKIERYKALEIQLKDCERIIDCYDCSYPEETYYLKVFTESANIPTKWMHEIIAVLKSYQLELKNEMENL